MDRGRRAPDMETHSHHQEPRRRGNYPRPVRPATPEANPGRKVGKAPQDRFHERQDQRQGPQFLHESLARQLWRPRHWRPNHCRQHGGIGGWSFRTVGAPHPAGRYQAGLVGTRPQGQSIDREPSQLDLVHVRPVHRGRRPPPPPPPPPPPLHKGTACRRTNQSHASLPRGQPHDGRPRQRIQAVSQDHQHGQVLLSQQSQPEPRSARQDPAKPQPRGEDGRERNRNGAGLSYAEIQEPHRFWNCLVRFHETLHS
mmetsp:Transcript_29334/g.68916  ORF Transcript_29334/g.68916 Transcript_29334/m.68916 type:complete len:255 (+) Transcript_29334:1049-1813(+)